MCSEVTVCPLGGLGGGFGLLKGTVPGCPGAACSDFFVPQEAEGREELRATPSLWAVPVAPARHPSHGHERARGPKLQLQPPRRGDGVCRTSTGKGRPRRQMMSKQTDSRGPAVTGMCV